MSNFNLIPVNQITNMQYKNDWLIKNVMESKSIGMLFGAPASAKSFIAMDMAFCVATGTDWHGKNTKQGKVVYIAGEGFNGMSKRFKALESKYNTVTSDVYLSEVAVNLTSTVSAEILYQEIMKTCSAPTLIIIDTLHRNFGDRDENSARDLGVFIDIVSAITNATGATALIVHHSGHGSSDRARGSSSLKAAMDFEYKVEKRKSLVTMSCTKAKDFSEPPPQSFNLIAQPLPGWFDGDGKPIESAILESAIHTPIVRKPDFTKKDMNVLAALEDAVAATGLPAKASHISDHPELQNKLYLHVDDWRKAAYQILDDGLIKKASLRQAFVRSKDKLINKAKVLEIDSCIYQR